MVTSQWNKNPNRSHFVKVKVGKFRKELPQLLIRRAGLRHVPTVFLNTSVAEHMDLDTVLLEIIT